MSSQSSRLPRAVALGAAAAVLAIGAVAATGCGSDDESNVGDALRSVTEALSTAEEQAKSVRSEAEERAKSIQEQAQSVQSEAESELERERRNDDLRGGY
jgi:Ran GTPase-activating protein (RanGAP) involved in mRNA processing and transport